MDTGINLCQEKKLHFSLVQVIGADSIQEISQDELKVDELKIIALKSIMSE